MGIRITGVGAYVPQKIVTNDDLVAMVDTSQEWILTKTGIRERRIAGAGEAPSDMGCQAAQRCLSHAGVDKSAVDLIVVACATPDQSQPAVACMIQEKLGMADRQCPAFDVNSVCAGFVFALNVAQSMMLADPHQFRNVLVIGTDAFSQILNWKDRRTCVFFGDGAGAVLLTQDAGRRPADHFPTGQRRPGQPLHRGSGRRHPRCRSTPEVLEKRLNTFTMDGPRVWDFAMQVVPADHPRRCWPSTA